MKGIILTIEQKDSIQGVLFTPYQIFNCVQDENDIWFTFLTEEDKQDIKGTDFEWILQCELKDYISKNENIS